MSKVLDPRSLVGPHVGSSNSVADLVNQGSRVGLSMGGLGGTTAHLQNHQSINGLNLEHHHTAALKMGITNDIAKSLPPDTTIALGGDNPPAKEKESGPEPIKQSLLVHIASLILYGCQALPIRLKILLDRLLSLLNHDEVMQLLSGFSWTYEDYERGYKLQDRSGQVLHNWHMMSPEEESLVLRQFLRFSETKDVAQQLLKQQPAGQRDSNKETPSDSKDPIRESLSVRSDLQPSRDTIKDSLSLSPRQSDPIGIKRETSDSLRETLRLRDSRELVEDSRKPMRSYMDNSIEPKLHVKDSSELFRESRDPMRDMIRPHKESRDLIRDSRDSTREPREPLRELREPLRESKEPPKDYYGNQTPNFPRGQPPSYNSTEALKALDPEIKKFLERTNMLFNPFMQGGSGDLLRPPPPSSHLGLPAAPLPAAPPQISPANLATNFLGAAQSSLAQSLLMNQQLSSMLRLPVPPVSLQNLSKPGNIPTNISSSTSPGVGVTPLNHLQNLQPFDFRKSSHSPKSASSGPHSGLGASDFTGTADIGRPAFSRPLKPDGITGIPPSSSQLSPPAPLPPLPPTSNSLHSSYSSDNCDISSSISGATSTALNLSTASSTSSSTTSSTSSTRLESSSGELSSAIRDKQNWNPINMATTYVNPVTGKKRVQCTVCLKTFCDKGALKIHFSAVHLREMHKCTVEGCTMMFSSRRSRNRHSANPSPKLHTPHIRRKISPHDGRSALSTSPLLSGFRPPNYPVRPGFPPLGAFPPPFGAINPLTGLPAFIPPPSAEDMNRNRLGMHHRSLEMQYGMGGNNPFDISKDQNRPLDNGGLSASMGHYYNDKNIDDDTGRMEVEGSGEDLDDSMSVDAVSLRGDALSPSSTKRKRKNQHPTKFAFRLEDDDLISTDDEYDDDDIDAKDSDEDKNIDKELDAMSDCDDEDSKGEQKDTASSDKSKSDGSNANVTSSSNDEAVDTSSALQHLENLSKNHFPGSLSANTTESFEHQNPPSTSPALSDNGSDGESISALENEENFHVSPDGFLTNTNVPIDKENPRQCVACGKIFQNHFTVKIHYQSVHLKLMHTCTVTGCNAAFPSKRSRDRHASNLTLHRKLLSTSTTQPSFPGLGFPGLPFNPLLNPELLARLYSDPSNLQNNLNNPTLGSSTEPPPIAHPPPHLFFQNLLPHLAANNNFQNLGMTERSGNRSPQSTSQPINNQNFSRSQSPSQTQTADKPAEGDQETPVISSPTREGEDQIDWQYNLEDDLPSPDRDGNMPCKFCMKAFGDGIELKNHYDEVHRGELFKCTVSGCNKLFSSRRHRNNHAINSELHRNLEGVQGRESEHCQTDTSTPEQATLA